MGDENNLYYLRGRRFTRKEAAADNQAIWSELYRLRDAELHKSPTETLAHVVKEIGRSNGRGTGWFPTSIEDWDQLRNEFQYGGRAIYDWPFAPLLSQAGLSDECIQMIRDCGGFAAPYDTSVNAGTALQLMSNFPANPQFNTLRNGYEYLPFRLGQAIRERETGQIWEGYTAESFDITDNGFQLIARNQSSFEQKFSCKKIVLALPRLALERLVEKSPLFKNRQFCKNLESVIPLPLTKINLFYAERWWWNRYGVRNGGSYSTLPLGSVYCYDPDTDDTDGPAVLTIYCDSSRRTYWQGLQDGGKPYNSEMFPDPPASSRPASVEVVQQVQRYLNEMFGAEDIPAPLLATYKAWGSNNEGDANHQWVVGANDQKVREQIWSPLRDVFVCGEAYSNEQCWVEGALRSAECVLQKGFGLSPPFAFHGSPATV